MQTKNFISKPGMRHSFTLVELVVVLVIVIILLTIGLVSMKGFFASNQLQAATRQMYDALNQARAHAITQRKLTRVFFPKNDTSTPSPYTDASFRFQSYIIADNVYDTAWRWVARTKWEFLPKGTSFDSATGAATTSGSGSACVVLTQGNTAFGTPHDNPAIYHTMGSGAGSYSSTSYAYIGFKPTGAAESNKSLKIVEGVCTGNSVTYTNQNASGGSANYSLITTDNLTGRLRIKKPGSADGGC